MSLTDILLNAIKYNVEGSGSGSATILPKTPTKGSDLIDVSDLEPESKEVLPIKAEKEVPQDEADEDDEDKVDEEEEEEETLEDELLEDIEEPDEEKLELSPAPSSRRQILKDFPDIFKKHPSLEKSYYRDQKFSEHFSTPKEAEEASVALQNYGKFEQDLSNGSLESVLNSVKEMDGEAFNKVIDNLMPTLEKVDRDSWIHIMNNNAKTFIYDMYTKGQKIGDEEIQNAARAMNKFYFQSEEYTPPVPLSKGDSKKNPKEEELSRKEKEFNERQFNTAKNEVDGRVERLIDNTISKEIDPKGSMSDYVKRNAIRDAKDTLTTHLKNDKVFQKALDRLWDNAKSKNYDKGSLDKIREAQVSKASSLIRGVINKARNEALKGSSLKKKSEEVEEEEEPVDSTEEKRVQKRVKARPHNDGPSKNERVIPKGMSTAEWLALK